MKIAFVYTHHRRTLNWYYKRAAQRLGHEVWSVGPWDDQPFGTYGREPDSFLADRTPRHYEYAELKVPWTPDVLWLLEGGEDIRVLDVPVPFVHQSVEGSHMDWSRTVTPHRYVNFTCNGAAPPDVTFLPYGFDRQHCDRTASTRPIVDREYDCAQVGSARPSRALLWDDVSQRAKDIHCWFNGSFWGPAHFELYRNARSTFVNQTHDFMCPRVFDAMAMGCVLFSDRVPSIMSLFEEGEHFIGYDSVRAFDGESVPHTDWLIEQIRRCRREPEWAQRISTAARVNAWQHHTYEHRVQRVLEEI